MPISSHLSYLQKHRFLPRQIAIPPKPNLAIVVVIPVHRELNLLNTLESLEQCESPRGAVEVILVLNASIAHGPEIHDLQTQAAQLIDQWVRAQERNLAYWVIRVDDLPKKHAGVGLARKIGLDEAVDRFEQAGKEDGILVWLDADCEVMPNYLTEIQHHFQENPKKDVSSIRFEHPVSGNAFPEKVYRGACLHELHLRYYLQGLRNAGHPYACPVLGSALAVRSSAYQRMNGMNRRKTGEAFYFLHKFTPQGKTSELTSTCVYPAPRISDRVPMGTGDTISKWLMLDTDVYETFDHQVFVDLGALIAQFPTYWLHQPNELPDRVLAFLEEVDFAGILEEAREHTAGRQAFVKRLFNWFEGLRVQQFLQYVQQQLGPRPDVRLAAARQLELMGRAVDASNEIELLQAYREIQQTPGEPNEPVR
ncbi:glycosyltransferase [Pontibacter sp. G13]|uniref:glycosyltransferase n=1 Tax=Pontibacter sp. G13 TaxID=3074898 RepID=UPI002889C67A|nr:glycosyltransferase [Pontibacter sp. G13]WNJ18701.1 glycosyltransferase [Pontibacter sp. G13]